MKTSAATPRQVGDGVSRVAGELAPTFVLMLAVLVVVGELAWWLDWRFLASVAASRLVLAVVTAMMLVVLVHGWDVDGREAAQAEGSSCATDRRL